jgi:hypothetical protein
LASDLTASPFCVSYLSMSTHTVYVCPTHSDTFKP